MAQIIQYGLQVDSTGAVKGLDQAAGAAEDLNNELNNASKGAKDLSNSVGDIGDSTEQSIKKAEARIKSIDGSIKLLGGAVETTVGFLGLLGVPPEVQEQFQKAAASAIAFADGIKRLFEGYKDITEARKLYQAIQVTGTALSTADTTATAANTAARVANTAATTANTAAGAANNAVFKAAIPQFKSTNILMKALNLAVVGVNAALSALNKVTGLSVDLSGKLAKSTTGWVGSFRKGIEAVGAALGTGPLAALAIALTGLVAIYATLTRRSKEWGEAQKKNRQIQADLTAATIQAGQEEERLLRILTDNIEQRGLEKQAIEELKKAYPGFIAFLDSENKLTQQGINFLQTRIKLRKAEAGLAAVAQKQVEAEVELQTKYAQIDIDEGGKFTQRRANRREQAREETKVITQALAEQEKLFTEQVNKALIELDKYNIVLENQAKATKFADEVLTPYTGKIKDLSVELQFLYQEVFKDLFKTTDNTAYSGTILDVRYVTDLETSLKRITQVSKELVVELDDLSDIKFLSKEQLDLLRRLREGAPTELGQRLAERAEQYKQELLLLEGNEKAKTQLTEEYERDRNKIRRQYALENAKEVLGITSQFLSVIADVNQQNLELQLQQAQGNQSAIFEINRKAFADQKKLRIAQTSITTAESILNGFNATSTLPPPFNLIAGGILAAAYTALGAKTIANINATQFGGTAPSSDAQRPRFGGINLGGGATATAPGPGLLPGVGGGRIAGAPTVGTIGEAPVVQAYVLASDVTDGQQARAAIQNRRRLGAG